MLPITDSFTYDYFGSDIVYGRNSVTQLEGIVTNHGCSRALIVCGSNTGANDDLMGPIRDGLGETYVDTFDETTPDKLANTVYNGIERMDEVDPDVLIGVGGGSSLDIARQMSVFAADGRPLSAFVDAARDGQIEYPEPNDELTDVVTIPTTFAGADISSGGSMEVLPADESPTGQPIRVNGNIMPFAMVYDPNLFETSPMGALAGSAMNGFNKGLETLYAGTATPVTDATAIHGLRLLHESFPKLPEDPDAMERAVTGIILVQFQRQTSIIHAFGHGFSRRYPLQQGVIHAVMAPYILQYLFDTIDGRRELLAEGLNIPSGSMSDSDLATEIVRKVTKVRDSLGLPANLREVDPVDPDDFPAIAEFIVDDIPDDRAPSALDPTPADIESVLEDAW